MTDKEQQIICKYKLLNVKKFDGQPYCSCFSESCKNLPICDDNCQIFEDYKQLARKTQECENLKEDYKELEQRHDEAFKDFERLKQECEELKEKYKWYDHYKDSALLNKKLCDKASDERARYRKALEEIERLANENNELLQGYHHEWANNKLILEIISKATGEE